MSQIETYGPDNLRVACLRDEKGKKIKGESLFFDLYDYWTLIHAVRKVCLGGAILKSLF